MPGKKYEPESERRNVPSLGLIRRYEEIAGASRSMLEAAHRGDWVAVEQIEAQCREMIAALKRAASSETLSGSEKSRRVSLLRAILKDDAQIRMRAEPWLRDLENFLGAPTHTESSGP